MQYCCKRDHKLKNSSEKNHSLGQPTRRPLCFEQRNHGCQRATLIETVAPTRTPIITTTTTTTITMDVAARDVTCISPHARVGRADASAGSPHAQRHRRRLCRQLFARRRHHGQALAVPLEPPPHQLHRAADHRPPRATAPGVEGRVVG